MIPLRRAGRAAQWALLAGAITYVSQLAPGGALLVFLCVLGLQRAHFGLRRSDRVRDMTADLAGVALVLVAAAVVSRSQSWGWVMSTPAVDAVSGATYATWTHDPLDVRLQTHAALCLLTCAAGAVFHRPGVWLVILWTLWAHAARAVWLWERTVDAFAANTTQLATRVAVTVVGPVLVLCAAYVAAGWAGLIAARVVHRAEDGNRRRVAVCVGVALVAVAVGAWLEIELPRRWLAAWVTEVPDR